MNTQLKKYNLLKQPQKLEEESKSQIVPDFWGGGEASRTLISSPPYQMFTVLTRENHITQSLVVED